MSLHAFWQPASDAAISLIREWEKRTERASITLSCLLLAYISSLLVFGRERCREKKSVCVCVCQERTAGKYTGSFRPQASDYWILLSSMLNSEHSQQERNTDMIRIRSAIWKETKEGRKTSWQESRWSEWMKQHVEGIELPEQGKRSFLSRCNI